MIRISIETSEVTEVRGISNRTRQPFTLRKQAAWAFVTDRQGHPQPHPVRMELLLDKEQQPYAPGQYALAPSSVYVDRFGGLKLAPKLAPLPVASK